MHKLSREDLNSAELETFLVSRIPTTVMTANGEVQTNEEATVHVNDVHLFVTVQLLEDTPTILSLGKICEDHGYAYEWVGGQKPHLIKDGKKIQCNTVNYLPIVVPGLAFAPSSSTASTILNISIEGLNA